MLLLTRTGKSLLGASLCNARPYIGISRTGRPRTGVHTFNSKVHVFSKKNKTKKNKDKFCNVGILLGESTYMWKWLISSGPSEVYPAILIMNGCWHAEHASRQVPSLWTNAKLRIVYIMQILTVAGELLRISSIKKQILLEAKPIRHSSRNIWHSKRYCSKVVVNVINVIIKVVIDIVMSRLKLCYLL